MKNKYCFISWLLFVCLFLLSVSVFVSLKMMVLEYTSIRENSSIVYTGHKIISNTPSYIPAIGIYMDDNVANVGISKEILRNKVA